MSTLKSRELVQLDQSYTVGEEQSRSHILVNYSPKLPHWQSPQHVLVDIT